MPLRSEKCWQNYLSSRTCEFTDCREWFEIVDVCNKGKFDYTDERMVKY